MYSVRSPAGRSSSAGDFFCARYVCTLTFMRAIFVLRVILTLTLGAGVGSLRAQCDTVQLATEVNAIEELTWSDYPKAIAQGYTLVRKYEPSAGLCLGQAFLALGKVQWVNGDYDSSLTTLDQGLKIARRINADELRGRIHLVMGNNYYYQGYYDSAEANFLEAHRIFFEMKHQTGLIEVVHDLALMYHRRGDFSRSLRYLLELESLKEAAPDFIHYIGDFTGISNYFIDTLYYHGVIADERNLFAKFTSENNNIGRFQSLINLATAYREMGDHRRAGFYAARGSEIMAEIGRYPFWYLAAEEYGGAGMEDSCFYYHRLALGELPKATKIKVAITYEHIAQSHLAFHRPDSALKYLELAFALNKAMNNRLTVAAMHADLAKIYAFLGQPERAEQHLLAGVRLAKQVSVKHTSTLYSFGRDFYEARNEPARALVYARLHQKLLDSINRNENAVELIRFQAQLETSRKERELEATRLTLRNRTVTVLSLAAIAVLSVSFVVVLFLQRRRIERQNDLLSERNQEQRAMVQEIHHRVKNNLQYIVSLLNLQAQTAQTEDLVSQIDEIKNRIMTMAVIHQRLYQVQGVHRVEVGPFVNELVTNVLNALPSRTPIARTLNIEPMQLDVDTAISLGLLINELMTNAVKHAFANHASPETSLSIIRDGSGLLLRMHDNGPGFRFPGDGNGFGMKLIHLLIRKLKGQLQQPDKNTLEIKMDVIIG